MKKITISLLVLLVIFGSACSDFLDITPSGQKDEKMVWSSRKEVEGYLANIYAGIQDPKLYQDDPWVGCADECDLSWTVYLTYQMNFGNWSEGVEFHNKYDTYYRAIRMSHIFEKNVDRCGELTPDLKARYKHEAIFLRGYFYWQLLKQYGPVVLVKEDVSYDADFSAYARAPYDECVDYICELMDEAAVGLPLSWKSADRNELGRPDQVVCKSVKSIVLHHAASPQFNGNKEYEGFVNKHGEQLINTTYDPQKWTRAAKAAKEVIDIAEQNPSLYGLYRNDEDGKGAFNPYKSYVDMQLKVWNKEIIFGRARSYHTRGWQIHTTPGPSALGGVGPTQRLVDAFLMKNGKPIEHPQSGYIEEGWATSGGDNWNPKRRDITTDKGKKDIINDIRQSDAYGHWEGDWNMFANREPRFYASILYNKRVIPQVKDDFEKRNHYSSPKQRDGLGRAELYLGGVSGFSHSTTFYSRTGYLSFKLNDPMAHLAKGGDRIWPNNYIDTYIRYATILLNYIEALNEVDPSNPDIKKYWDQIRSRAGVPSAFVATPEIAGDKDQQRDFIIRERLIELNMEGDRYFTTRRLWKSHLVPTSREDKFGDNGDMYGLDIHAGNSTTNDFDFDGFYNIKPFEKRVFRKSFYLFPIPKKEKDKSKIVQNPWW